MQTSANTGPKSGLPTSWDSPLLLSSLPVFHPLPGNPSPLFRVGKASGLTRLSVLLNSCLGGTKI